MAWLRRNRWLALGAVAVVAALIVFVGHSDPRPTVGDVETQIKTELMVGADSNSIQQFLERHQIEYSFDQYHDRYQAIIRKPKNSWFLGHAIQILVNVDKDKRFLSAEVFDVYTVP